MEITKDDYWSVINQILEYGRDFKQLSFDSLFDDEEKLSSLIENRNHLYKVGKDIEQDLLDNQKSEKLSFKEEEALDYLEKYIFCGYGKKSIYSNINKKLKSLEITENVSEIKHTDDNKKKNLNISFDEAVTKLNKINLDEISGKKLNELSKIYSTVQTLSYYANYLGKSSSDSENVKYISELSEKISSNYNIKLNTLLKTIKIKENDFYSIIYEPMIKDSCIKNLVKHSNQITENDIMTFLKNIGYSRINYIKGNYEKNKWGKTELVQNDITKIRNNLFNKLDEMNQDWIDDLVYDINGIIDENKFLTEGNNDEKEFAKASVGLKSKISRLFSDKNMTSDLENKRKLNLLSKIVSKMNKNNNR